jgi:transposase
LQEIRLMMGERRVMQEALFYGFSLERHVPDNHMLRKIDRFVDLSDVRAHLEPYYSEVGRPSIDPELMIRMLIVGYCFGVRSERRLCEEVHLNLAYRWFCRWGSTATFLTIRRSRRTAMAVSARAISCASCSRLFFGWKVGRNQVSTDNSDDCELSLVGSVLRLNLTCLGVPGWRRVTALARATVGPKVKARS